MADDNDRMARAGEYVLGTMTDSERLRAERDLLVDASFREAVVEAAERMHIFQPPSAPVADTGWAEVKDRLAGLPQMRPSTTATPPASPGRGGAQPMALPAMTPQQPLPRVDADGPVTFGRRRTDWVRPTVQPVAMPKAKGLHAVTGRLAVGVAAGIVVAFALGYVVGVSSVTGQLPAMVTLP